MQSNRKENRYEYAGIFERYHSILPELLGVAQVHINDAIVTEVNVEKGAFYVHAKPAPGTKCENPCRSSQSMVASALRAASIAGEATMTTMSDSAANRI